MKRKKHGLGGGLGSESEGTVDNAKVLGFLLIGQGKPFVTF